METMLRTIARELLEKGEVRAVIGFRQGSLPHMTEPFMARTPDQADQLVFNANCRMNLASYLTPTLMNSDLMTSAPKGPDPKGSNQDRPGKIAVTAKGCDSRNIVTQIQENRFSRDQVYIIGLPCTGMTDRTAAAAGLSGEDHLQSNCRTCISRNPVMSDVMAGDPVPEPSDTQDRFADVERIEAMAPDERAAFFNDLVSSCTRCYACRNACPLCYCPTCFVDESNPQWVGKTVDPTDVMAYHIIRAFHDAGRCTDCGACEAACPMDIRMRLFTRKTIQDALGAYGWETGMDPALRPPLDRFDTRDREDFIR